MLQAQGASNRQQLSGEDMQEIVKKMKDAINRAGYGRQLQAALNDPFVQLENAIYSAINSWNRKRAVEYRHGEGISDAWYTPAIVQVMVFGNRNEGSGL